MTYTVMDALRRDLAEAEAVYANLVTRAATIQPNPRTDRSMARWIDEAEQDVVALRERVAKLEVAE